MRKLLLIVLSLFLISCVNPVGPTKVDETRHPNENKIIEYTSCYAEFHGIDVKVYIEEKAKLYACASGEIACPAKGWAWPDSDNVHYWGPWVRDEYDPDPVDGDWELSMVASHEVCHLTGIWDETRTELCATDAYNRSECK